MKRKLFIVIGFVCMLMLGLDHISAATYSSSKSNNMNLAGGVYKVSGTATYHTSGDKRWTYSNESMVFQSGTAPRGYSITSKRSLDNKVEAGIQRTAREYNCVATNINYVEKKGTIKHTWYFNTKTKKFVSGFEK